MPGKYGVIDTAYTPITYDEWMKPLVELTRKHEEAEASLAELDANAALLSQYATEQGDPKAYARYQDYANRLKAVSDDLARNGVNPGVRRSVFDLNTRFNRDVKPIETAYNARNELIKTQATKGPDWLFQRDARTMSLDEFLDNPVAGYGGEYDGKQLTSMAAQEAQAINKAILDDPEKWRPILLTHYEKFVQHGYTPEEVIKAQRGDRDADPILTGIIDRVLDMSGVREWADGETLARARQYAASGLMSAVGESKYDYLQESAGASGAGGGETNITGYHPVVSRIFTPEEQDRRAVDYAPFLKYFTQDGTGNYSLNQEGVNRYYQDIERWNTGEYGYAPVTTAWGVADAWSPVHEKSDFLKFIDTLMDRPEYADLALDPDNLSGLAGDAFTKFMNDNHDLFTDASQRWRYDYHIGSATKGASKDIIGGALGDREITGVTFASDGNGGGQYVGGGNSATFRMSDIKSIDTIHFSEYGVTVEASLNPAKEKDGKEKYKGRPTKVEFMLPNGVDDNEKSNLMSAYGEAMLIREQLQRGETTDGTPLSDYARKALSDRYDEYIQECYHSIALMFKTIDTVGTKVSAND